MKKSIFTLSIIFIVINSSAQNPKYGRPILEKNVKKFHYIETSYFKTTHIIFPHKIRYADTGSTSIVIEAADQVENVLKLKANEIGFPETNLSVITSDGAFYSFIVNYNEMPQKLSFECSIEDAVSGKNYPTGGGVLNRDNIMFSNTKFGVRELNRISETLVEYNDRLLHIGDKTGKVRFHLNGVYGKENYIFLCVEIENDSELPYGVDFMKAYVRDVERRKKELNQEFEVPIIYSYWQTGEAFNVEPRKNKEYVLMVDTFQMQEGKRLEIDLNEKRGGRNCTLKIDFRTFEELLKRI